MDRMTDEELRKLLDEAPEGPWTLRYYEEWEGQLAWEILAAGQAAGNGFMGDTAYYPWQPATSATVELIAAIPDLAAEVLRLREHWDDAYVRGFAAGQEALRAAGQMEVIDSPELVGLRAALAERDATVAALVEALGPLYARIADGPLRTQADCEAFSAARAALARAQGGAE